MTIRAYRLITPHTQQHDVVNDDDDDDDDEPKVPASGKSGGCAHYDRGCSMKVRVSIAQNRFPADVHVLVVQAACCNAFYSCRLCHDKDSKRPCKVEMDRFAVSIIKCNACATQQPVRSTHLLT